MGAVPSWYRAIKAAQYLGVAPWDLAKAPLAWVERAEEAQAAENHARALADKREQARQGLK